MISVLFCQICSSMFLQPVWLDGYFSRHFANASSGPPVAMFDFRISGYYVFSSLQTYCQLAVVTVVNAQTVFIQEQFVSAQALSSKYHSQLTLTLTPTTSKRCFSAGYFRGRIHGTNTVAHLFVQD